MQVKLKGLLRHPEKSAKTVFGAQIKEERIMRQTEMMIKDLPKMEPFECEESNFWKKLIDNKLRPVPESQCLTNKLESKLKRLRYSTLIAIFLINLIWIMLFLTLTFEELELLNINPRVLIIVFLGIYGVILLVQFVTMIIHRCVTLAHYIARFDESNQQTLVSSKKSVSKSIVIENLQTIEA